MLLFHYIQGVLISAVLFLKGSSCENNRPFLKYYETVSYDRTRLLQSHQRSKRATNEEEKIVTLDLAAYNRNFSLMLRRDSSAFADDFRVVSHDQPLPVDISFVYKGSLKGENDSFCHGSIINGYFHGSIHTKNGTFYVEYEENHNGSIDPYIYHESDIDYSLLKDVKSFDMALKKYTYLENRRWKPQEESINRSKRSLDLSRTSCLLHLKADYYFFRSFRNLQEAISQIAGYLMAINAIFEQVNFNGIKFINFKVKVLNIMQKEQPDNPLSSPYIGIEKLLMLHSKNNWNHVCLSYLLTNRDYSGTLGLAWVGKSGNLGGICSKFAKMQNTTEKVSLNTGVMTIQKYGQYLPQRVIHITLAHELGHSMGAPHDGDTECAKYAVNSPYGNYLMFPRAVDGNQYNNDKFSACSIQYISSLLKIKKDQCFVESGRPTCGNQIVETGEQCDVGFNDNDTCCYSANAEEGLQCTLKPGKQCSPSQGQCCSQQCELKAKGDRCRDEAECNFADVCTGESAKCPTPAPKNNYTLCKYGTRICLNGVCSKSVCVKFGLEQCDCTTENMNEMCHLCCQMPGNHKVTGNEAAYTLRPDAVSFNPFVTSGQRCLDQCSSMGVPRSVLRGAAATVRSEQDPVLTPIRREERESTARTSSRLSPLLCNYLCCCHGKTESCCLACPWQPLTSSVGRTWAGHPHSFQVFHGSGAGGCGEERESTARTSSRLSPPVCRCLYSCSNEI